MRWFFKRDFRSFYLLNATQFLGALNDNIFKLLVIYLLINVKGAAAAPTILSLAGAIFVIPFLLFSSGAGVLADRISKRTIIVIAKFLELAVMLCSIFAIYLQSEFGSFTCLFFMAAQSALFGPSKYGIIPELVEEKMVSKANGSLTSLTYLAIIAGTFLASFLTDITNKNFVVVSCFCVLIAAVGLLTSFGITRTAPQRSTKKINPMFLYEIYQTLKVSWKVPHLLTAMFSSAFFLFIGAFMQLNIIPFAMQSLHLSEVGGGYLFLAIAVGIAMGAVIAGQVSKDKVEPGISCIAGFFISIFFFTLSLFSFSLIATVINLVLLGIAGGTFLIPFDSFIQIKSPDEKRGQIIAASNFFSFVGVLCSAFFLYFLSEELSLSASSGFVFMSLMSLIATFIIAGRLSSFFFPFFAHKILKKFRLLHPVKTLPKPSDVLILQSTSWWDALLLFGCFPNIKIFVPGRYFRTFPWINGWIDSIRLVSSERMFFEAKKAQDNNQLICLFFHQKAEPQLVENCKETAKQFHAHPIFAKMVKERVKKRWIFPFSQTQITMTFE